MFDLLLACFIHFQIIIIIYTIWLHKGYQHKSIIPSKTLDHIGRFVMWTIAWGTSSTWLRYSAGSHRMHHMYADTTSDPHSPFYISLKGLLFGGEHNPFFDHHSPADLENHALDVPILDDWIQTNIYDIKIKKCSLGIFVPALIYGLIFGLPGIVVGLICNLFFIYFLFPFVATWVIHKLGMYRHPKHQFPDRSLNVFPIAILLGGVELHSNHHHNPVSVNDAVRWFEFDIGYWYVKLFEKLGLLEINYRIVDRNKS